MRSAGQRYSHRGVPAQNVALIEVSIWRNARQRHAIPEPRLRSRRSRSREKRWTEYACRAAARSDGSLYPDRVRSARERCTLANSPLPTLSRSCRHGGRSENAWRVRERVLEGMEWLGVELDRQANEQRKEVISSVKSVVRVFVIPTNEEQIIARHALHLADTRADALA